MSLFSIANFDESMTSLPSGGGECNIIEVDTLTELKAKTADEALGKIFFVKKDESNNDLNQYYVYDFTKSQFITLGEGGESVIKVYEYLDELPYPASLEEFKAMFGKIYVVKKIRMDNYNYDIYSVSTIEEMKGLDVDSSKDGAVIKVLKDGNIYKYVATNNEWVIATAGTDYQVINENSYFVADSAALKDWIAKGNTEESFDSEIEDELMYPYTALITDSISLETMRNYLGDKFSIVANIDNVTEEGIIYYVKNGNADYSRGYYYFYKEEPHYIGLESIKTLPALVAYTFAMAASNSSSGGSPTPTVTTSFSSNTSGENLGDTFYRLNANKDLNNGEITWWNNDILYTQSNVIKIADPAGRYSIVANNIRTMLDNNDTKLNQTQLISIFSGYPMISGKYWSNSSGGLSSANYQYAFKVSLSSDNGKYTLACYYMDVSFNDDNIYSPVITKKEYDVTDALNALLK